MMYDNKLAVAVKSNGKVLREFKDVVYLPFGSEYSFLIKNLNTKRAVVKIEIDGVEVTGGGLVVNANSSVDFERFLNNSNLNKGHKFKFIERTASIEQHRGVKVEDGLVRVEFEFEKEYPGINWHNLERCGPAIAKGADAISNNWLNNSRTYTGMAGDFMCGGSVSYSSNSEFIACASAVPQNEVGITVEGSISDQKFVSTFVNTDGVKHVMVMKFLGETDQGVQVQQPVTVKNKNECKYCGKGNKFNMKFCGECGASLQII